MRVGWVVTGGLDRSGRERVMILDARGDSVVYVNDELRAGDPYGNGLRVSDPVKFRVVNMQTGGTGTGSGRSIAGFHLRDALDLVAKRAPGVLLRFGGHAMAAGCTVAEEHFEVFEATLEQVAREWLDQATLQRRLETDGPLAPEYRRTELVDMLAQEDVESRLIVHGPQGWKLRHGPLPRRSLPPFSQKRWTFLVQGVDLHHQGVHQLLQQFRFVPDARLDDLMISYASDGGGVGPHTDSYDVFLLQGMGRRRWRIGRAETPQARELVAGDVVLLEAGNYVPADLRLLTSVNLKVEEASLTGESVPVDKSAASAGVGVAASTVASTVACGSLVVRGHGLARVTATGAHTEMGRIGRAIVSPSRIASVTLAKICSNIAFPDVSRVIVSPSRIGTPLPNRMPSVRVKRPVLAPRVRRPISGTRNMKLSTRRRNSRPRSATSCTGRSTTPG